MAITAETLRLSRELRITISQLADQQTRELVKAWVQAWDDLREEMQLAAIDLASIDPGRWPTPGQISRHARAQRALALIAAKLQQLADQAVITITDQLDRTVTTTAAAQPLLIASQLPARVGASAVIASRFDRVAGTALDAIVQRSTEQVTSLAKPLPAEATAAMKRALIRGVAMGDNPRITAARMVGQVEGHFNGGLTRALTIARTELLDASRAAAAAQQRANRGVLAGWIWLAELGPRTCPSCWAKHGQWHTQDEDGPLDHQRGRCTRMPVTKSWRELGFDMDEPPSVLPDAQATFRAMPRTEQLAVMGPGRLAALDSGAAQWGDLSALRTTTGWRDSYGVTPVRDLTT